VLRTHSPKVSLWGRQGSIPIRTGIDHSRYAVTQSRRHVFVSPELRSGEGLDNDIEGWDIGAGVKAMW